MPELIKEDKQGWQLPPLTDDEYSLLLGQHSFADSVFTGVDHFRSGINNFPHDSAIAQSLRYKIMAALKVRPVPVPVPVQNDCCDCDCDCDCDCNCDCDCEFEGIDQMGCKCGCGGSGGGSGGVVDPGSAFGPGGKGTSPGGSNGKQPPDPHGGIGTGKGKPTGSGPGGGIVSGDEFRDLGGCIEIFRYPYCSPSINLNQNITAEIRAALEAAPTNPLGADEELVSVQLQVFARATVAQTNIGWSGVGIQLGDATPKVIYIQDAANNHNEVAYTVETLNAEIPVIGGVKHISVFYNDNINTAMEGTSSILIVGNLQRNNPNEGPTPECDVDNSDNAAGMVVCATSYVVFRPETAYGFAFTPLDNVSVGVWDNAGVGVNCTTNNLATFRAADGNILSDSLQWQTPGGTTIAMVKPTDKIYTGVTFTGKCVSEGGDHHIDLYNGATLLMADFMVISVAPTNFPANSSDLAHTPKPFNGSGTFTIPVGTVPSFVITVPGAANNPQYTWDFVGRFLE